MTLQLRLTIWYTALLGFTLALFSLLVYIAMSQNLYSKIEQDARVQAAIITELIRAQLNPSSSFSTLVPRSTEGNFQVTLQFIEIPTTKVFVGIGDVQLFDLSTGNVLRSTRKRFDHPVPIQSEDLQTVRNGSDTYRGRITYQDTQLAVYTFPIETDTGVIGGQVVQSIATVDHALEDMSRFFILGSLVSLIIAALVGAYLAHRTLKPLQTITHTASGITKMGDLGRRLSIPDQSSEVGQLAATFNEMLNRIQHLFKTQERLIADVSHELRTPLTTIQGNVELLQRVMTQTNHQPSDSLVGDTMRETLGEVEDEANRMGRMISDLLLLAQADSGGLKLNEEIVEMDTLLLDIYRQTRRIANRTKGADGLLVRIGSEDQALVKGDRDRLRQLLLNLAENAVKYTPIGGTITLSLTKSEGLVQVQIQDTGIGISEENQQLIFDRFYRTDKARSREMGGSGLGLSICQWIAKAHGGRITVKSSLHKGSEFTLWLPTLDRESSANASANVNARSSIITDVNGSIAR
ncbi:MAG: HAMP domain-containing sensor histidine kinase [Chloroflexota bacterium]